MRPLLKWAGGKRQLLPALEQYYPASFDRYLEPFVGSGAVFFHLASTGALDGRAVTLSDVNRDLIGCYRAVRDETESVITALQALEREHRRRGDDCYYDVRDRRFNPQRAAMATGDTGLLTTGYPPELAAMLIFLNRTGFNGLFRLNRLGAFNVPAGRYREPRICDPEHIQAVAGVLRRPRVVIQHRGFEEAIGEAGKGDFVYCDPPYAPLSRTAAFTSYTAGGFDANDQRRLQRVVIELARRGCHVLLSNSTAGEIAALYEQSAEARRAGLRVARVPARRAINSNASRRGAVDEFLITNIEEARD